MSEDRISGFGQIKIYIGKCFRLFKSEKQWKNFISTLIIVFIICMVTDEEMFREYLPTKNGCFAVVCACIWTGLFNSIQSVCRERAIIKREYRTGLRISSYVLAHAFYELVLCLGESLIIIAAVIVKNQGHLPEEGLCLWPLMDLWFSFFLITFSADMIALLISCIVKDENTAMTVMPFILIIQLVMSGSVFELKGVSETISQFTVSKWGMNVLVAIANTDSGVYTGYGFRGGSGSEPELKTALLGWGVMLLFALVYILLAMLLLRRVDKDKR